MEIFRSPATLAYISFMLASELSVSKNNLSNGNHFISDADLSARAKLYHRDKYIPLSISCPACSLLPMKPWIIQGVLGLMLVWIERSSSHAFTQWTIRGLKRLLAMIACFSKATILYRHLRAFTLSSPLHRCTTLKTGSRDSHSSMVAINFSFSMNRCERNRNGGAGIVVRSPDLMRQQAVYTENIGIGFLLMGMDIDIIGLFGREHFSGFPRS